MFTVPTLPELHALLIALAEALLPGIDTSAKSFPALFTKAIAAAATDVHAHINAVQADLLPTTAQGTALDQWGAVLALPRKGATGARKADALRVVNTDVVSRTVTTGATLTHVSGLQFKANETKIVTAGTYADIDVAAVSTGAATRLASCFHGVLLLLLVLLAPAWLNQIPLASLAAVLIASARNTRRCSGLAQNHSRANSSRLSSTSISPCPSPPW